MKLQTILLYALLAVCIVPSALAQDDGVAANTWRNYSFRPPQLPTTHALALKGQMRIELGYQVYWPEKQVVLNEQTTLRQTGPVGPKISPSDIPTEIPSLGDLRIGANYTPWKHFSVGVALMGSYRRHVGQLESQPLTTETSVFNHNNLFRYQPYTSSFLGGELSGTFHAVISSNFACEVRTTLLLGSGRHVYSDSYTFYKIGAFYQDELSFSNYEVIGTTFINGRNRDDILRYGMFNQCFDIGLSAFTSQRLLQATLLFNVGYTTYFNKKLDEPCLSQQLYAQVIDPFNQNPMELCYTPSFLIRINTPKIATIQLHCSVPFSHSNTIKPVFGLNVTWRILKTGIMPSDGEE